MILSPAHWFMRTANKKSNLHINSQVKVLPMGPLTLSRWCRLAADTINVVDLCIRDEILSFPDNIPPFTLADMLDVVDGIEKGNLDCITDLYHGVSVLVTLITTPCST
jgi:hypothetical protein